MKRALTGLLAVVAMATALGVGSTAQADQTIRVRIDNYLTNGDTYARSANTVTVSIRYCWNCPWHAYNIQSRVMNTLSNAHDFIFTNSNLDAYDVYQIRLQTNGGDLFIVDQIELFDTVGNFVDSVGVDNTAGYCLSTQADDLDYPGCATTPAGSTLLFTL